MQRNGSATLLPPGTSPPAKSTSAQSPTYRPTTCAALISAISSRASGDGRLPCDWRAGTTLDLFGPAAAHASHSAPPGKVSEKKTRGTSGPSFDASSPSAVLQSSLANKLRRRLDVNGSPEYVLTWKDWPMQSGPPICALRARARPTSGSGCGGWPTPMAGSPATENYNAAGNTDASRKTLALLGVPIAGVNRTGWPTPTRQDSASSGAAGYSTESGRHPGTTLTDAARFAGWNTPRATDGSNGGPNQTGGALPADAAMAGWATPTTRDWKSESATEEFYATRDEHSRGKPLSYQARGATTSGSPAPTEKRGALNPALSRWLMGYPTEGDDCAPTVTPSSRKSRPSLSVQ